MIQRDARVLILRLAIRCLKHERHVVLSGECSFLTVNTQEVNLNTHTSAFPHRRYNWQTEGNCMRNEKISAPKEIVPVEEPAATTESESDNVFFYPMDLVTGKCSSDASQRPPNFDAVGFTLFFTRELCCQFW